MKLVSVGHLSDQALVRETRECVARDRANTAALLAHLAEIDARRLYAATRFDSMYAWCVGELNMSEDAAAKRLTVARKARRFPALLEAIADGRLHLSGASLLAPHLTQANCAGLIAAATHRSKAQIEEGLADRFPRPDLPSALVPLAPSTNSGLAPAGSARAAAVFESGSVSLPPASTPTELPSTGLPPAPDVETYVQHAPGRVEVQSMSGLPAGQTVPGGRWPTHARIIPLSPGRYGLQVTLDQEAHDLLLEARALLGHAIPSGDHAQVLGRALKLLVHELARRKHGAPAREDRPGRKARTSSPDGSLNAKPPCQANERHIPDRIKNAVWERDGGRCAFVDASGRRCESRTRLEFDHVTPVACGGLSTAGNLRLLCRTHNQHEARRVFGAGLVNARPEQSRKLAGGTADARRAPLPGTQAAPAP